MLGPQLRRRLLPAAVGPAALALEFRRGRQLGSLVTMIPSSAVAWLSSQAGSSQKRIRQQSGFAGQIFSSGNFLQGKNGFPLEIGFPLETFFTEEFGFPVES